MSLCPPKNKFQTTLEIELPRKSPNPRHLTFKEKVGGVKDVKVLKQACSSEYQRAQCAFKDLMIHWDLQFTLRIAFRCVLHRCESQEIRCLKLFLIVSHILVSEKIKMKGVFQRLAATVQ
jgi:hypothetical protein